MNEIGGNDAEVVLIGREAGSGTRDGLKNATEYITRNSETIYYGGINVCPERAYKQMRKVKKYYGKASGNQLIHFIVCFNSDVQDIETAKCSKMVKGK